MKLVAIAGAILACGSMLAGGCQSTGGPSYDIHIAVGSDVGESTQVLVYMKGYADSEYVPMAAAGEFRDEKLEDLMSEMSSKADWSFVSGDEGQSKTLYRTDDVWADWRLSANWVVVFARAGVEIHEPLALPLAKDKWEGREISIEVESRGLDLKTKQVVN